MRSHCGMRDQVSVPDPGLPPFSFDNSFARELERSLAARLRQTASLLAAPRSPVASDELALIAESQLFGQRVQQRRRHKATSADGQDELAIHGHALEGRPPGRVGQRVPCLRLDHVHSARLKQPSTHLSVISFVPSQHCQWPW